jgi:hypothetical protein
MPRIPLKIEEKREEGEGERGREEEEILLIKLVKIGTCIPNENGELEGQIWAQVHRITAFVKV